MTTWRPKYRPGQNEEGQKQQEQEELADEEGQHEHHWDDQDRRKEERKGIVTDADGAAVGGQPAHRVGAGPASPR
jgi:hypothetical protein